MVSDAKTDDIVSWNGVFVHSQHKTTTTQHTKHKHTPTTTNKHTKHSKTLSTNNKTSKQTHKQTNTGQTKTRTHRQRRRFLGEERARIRQQGVATIFSTQKFFQLCSTGLGVVFCVFVVCVVLFFVIYLGFLIVLLRCLCFDLCLSEVYFFVHVFAFWMVCVCFTLAQTTHNKHNTVEFLRFHQNERIEILAIQTQILQEGATRVCACVCVCWCVCVFGLGG